MNESTLSDRLRGLTAEHALLVGLILLSAWMFVESFTFREPSGLFPRFAAAVTIGGSLLLLVRNYLPPSVQSFVMESADVFDSYEEDLEDLTDEEVEDLTAEEIADIPDEQLQEELTDEQLEEIESSEGSEWSLRRLYDDKRFMLSALTTVYVVTSYLVGFLATSPVFVVAYSLYVGHSRVLTGFLTALSLAVVFGFMQILNVPLDRGILFG